MSSADAQRIVSNQNASISQHRLPKITHQNIAALAHPIDALVQQMNRLTSLLWGRQSLLVPFLVNSGTDYSFIDENLAKQV